MRTIIGVFADRVDVEDAIAELRDTGYDAKDISIIMQNKSEGAEIANSTGANVTEGAVSGAATGAVIGGLAGLVSAVALPGIGAFLIGGPIAAALGLTGTAAATVSGATTGALAGGLIGALMGLGLPREEAEYYEGRIREGAILIAVPAGGAAQQDEVTAILDDYNAEDIKVISQSTRRAVDEDVDEDVIEDYPSTGSRFDYEGTGQPYATIGSKGGKRTVRRSRRS